MLVSFRSVSGVILGLRARQSMHITDICDIQLWTILRFSKELIFKKFLLVSMYVALTPCLATSRGEEFKQNLTRINIIQLF